MSELTSLFATPQMQIIVGLVVADIVLGVVGAVVKKEFSLRKLGNFAHSHILGFAFGFALVELIGQALPAFALFVQVAFGMIALTLAASLVRNLGKFGLPVPAIFK